MSQKAGYVYVWLMLNTIINITDDVTDALQTKLDTFGTKGLLSFPGESVKKARINVFAICIRLDERGSLQSDTTTR